MRIFKPANSDQPRPAFVWCFGGGFIIGDLDTADGICRSIALAADCIVVAVRYRLAPEHDLSASRADALAALDWVAAHGAQLGIDSTRLAVGGDSAGGNLSAVLAQETLRRGGPNLSLQVLVYPATELVEKFPSYAENAQRRALLTDHAVQWIEHTLAASLSSLNLLDPWYSPRRSRSRNLHGLPPAVIVTAGFDPIRDDGLDYAARLRAADVPVQLLHYQGQFHGFLNFDSINGAGRDALQRIGDALREAFGRQPAADMTIEIADEAPRRRPGGNRGRSGDLNPDGLGGDRTLEPYLIAGAVAKGVQRLPASIEALVHSHPNDPGQSPAGQNYISRATCHGIGRLHDAKNFKLTQ